ncbi:DNA-binding protein [Haloarculaceae archaeon H-GB2-1]|nr:DNA-binding protein [Haloarculaceae archaeon H-GB2-1]
MSIEHSISNECTVEEQDENDAERFTVVREEPELRATVDLEIQAKVDTNHPDSGTTGLTLEAEETLAAREMEIERTTRRLDDRQTSDREARSRDVASRGTSRATTPSRRDPREDLTREELAAVNRQAHRVAADVEGYTAAAIGRRLAAQVAAGRELLDAVLDVREQLFASGAPVPLGALESVPSGEVTVEGRLIDVWETDSTAIQEVGLLDDESGRTKLTVWAGSDQPWIAEGERVRLYNAKKNWYEGRCSVALTRWSRVEFPDHDRWWDA